MQLVAWRFSALKRYRGGYILEVAEPYHFQGEIVMGFRFRKSVNLGGGFRVNFSKSGVGYSWGTKGYRVTKTAKGKVRTTATIPGTVISYVQEHGGKRKSKTKNQGVAKPRKQNAATIDTNHGFKETGKKVMGILIKIVLWIITVFFLLATLAYLPSIESVIYFVIAALVAPSKKWKNLLKKISPLKWIKSRKEEGTLPSSDGQDAYEIP